MNEIKEVVNKHAAKSKAGCERSQRFMAWISRLPVCFRLPLSLVVGLAGLALVLILFPLGLILLWFTAKRPIKKQAVLYGRMLGRFQTKEWDSPLLNYPWQVWLITELPEIWRKEGLWAVAQAQRRFARSMQDRLDTLPQAISAAQAGAPENMTDAMCSHLTGLPQWAVAEKDPEPSRLRRNK